MGGVVFLLLKLTLKTKTQTWMHILNLFEAVYKSHVLSLVRKGLECVDAVEMYPGIWFTWGRPWGEIYLGYSPIPQVYTVYSA